MTEIQDSITETKAGSIEVENPAPRKTMGWLQSLSPGRRILLASILLVLVLFAIYLFSSINFWQKLSRPGQAAKQVDTILTGGTSSASISVADIRQAVNVLQSHQSTLCRSSAHDWEARVLERLDKLKANCLAEVKGSQQLSTSLQDLAGHLEAEDYIARTYSKYTTKLTNDNAEVISGGWKEVAEALGKFESGSSENIDQIKQLARDYSVSFKQLSESIKAKDRAGYSAALASVKQLDQSRLSIEQQIDYQYLMQIERVENDYRQLGRR